MSRWPRSCQTSGIPCSDESEIICGMGVVGSLGDGLGGELRVEFVARDLV